MAPLDARLLSVHPASCILLHPLALHSLQLIPTVNLAKLVVEIGKTMQHTLPNPTLLTPTLFPYD